jgi:hypothetical protein
MPFALDDATPELDVTPGPDTATWTPSRDTAPPAVHTGRPPRMVYAPWRRSQRTDLGATAVDAWHWRCRQPRCRVWSGPYTDLLDAKADGTDHHHNAHTRPHTPHR